MLESIVDFEVLNMIDLDQESVLAPEIQPLRMSVDLSAKPRTIFLTGVTGFVAAYVLKELLEQTDATIYTLVRGGDQRQSLQRICRNLSRYLLWHNRYEHRIIPVLGDLKYPRLGLSAAEFADLAQIIDSIYHVGSKLSYVAPYEFLKAANVGGTQETLRLVVTGKAKPYHFVSSLGIMIGYKAPPGVTPHGGMEDDPLDASKCPQVGYFQSKYVAESIVRIARTRGIPVTIHRIGLIVGDSQHGCSNDDDFVARILIGSIQAGYGPDIKRQMDMTPVDYVARAIVYLSRQSESLGKVFHLLNPQPITWSSIMDSTIQLGYPVEKLPFNAWVEAIEENGDPATNPLQPLLPFLHLDFAARMFGVSEAAYQALGTEATLRALAGSRIRCAPVDRTLVSTYVQRFLETGRLHPAPLLAAVG
jgi:thioester reductase-like protein